MNRAAALTLMFLSFAACQGVGKNSSVLKPDQFGDIPVPKGALYKSANEQSYSYRSDTFRCGRFLYSYDGTVDQALDFYRTWMTNDTYGWTFADESTTAKGSGRLVFTKNNDRCTVEAEKSRTPEQSGIQKTTRFVFIHIRLNYRYR